MAFPAGPPDERATPMDEEMQAIEIRDPELERRFDAFARLRLSPDAGAVARIRARVMREARLQHEAARIAAYVAPAVEARRRSVFRRAVMPLLAAAVWTAVAVGTIAAAQPGGGLYPARLWVERATLPTTAGARVDADLARLDDRMAEALAAASVGDRGALAASLEAYGMSAEDATATSAGDLSLGARVEAALGRHQVVLSALVAGLTARGNDVAVDAIERNIQRAIERNATVLAMLETRRGGDAADGGGNGGNGANGTGGGSSGATGGGAGAAAGGGAGPAGGGGGANGSAAGGGAANGSTGGGGGGPTAGGTSGTGGADGATTTSGAGAGASEKPGGGGAGGDKGGDGNEDDNSDGRPTTAPAASPVAPDHSPRAGG